MNAKRFFAAVLACLMTIPFAACEKTPPGEDTTAPAATDTTAPQETEPAVETDEYGREIIPDDIPADLRYDGEEMTIFTRNDNKYWLLEITADSDSADVLSDAVYRRNLTVEDRLGITINVLEEPGTFGKHQVWFNVLRGAWRADDGSIDAAAVYISQGAILMTEGMFQNLHNVDTIHLDKPWWNQSFNDELTVYGKLYGAVGDMMLSATSMTAMLYFNKNLLADQHGELNLYEVVESGEWTLDYFGNMIMGGYRDLDGDTAPSAGDYYAYKTKRDTMPGDAWPVALGIHATTKNEDGIPQLSFYNERTVEAFEKLAAIYDDEGTTVMDAVKFANGNVLFWSERLAMADTELRDVDFEYGILPMPKLYETDDYATIPQNGHSMLTVLNNADNIEMVGAALELLNAESYRQVTPAFFEITMKRKYLNSEDDAKMFDLILDSNEFNFGYVYSATCMGDIAKLMRDPSINIASTWASKEASAQQMLAELLDTLEGLADD